METPHKPRPVRRGNEKFCQRDNADNPLKNPDSDEGIQGRKSKEIQASRRRRAQRMAGDSGAIQEIPSRKRLAAAASGKGLDGADMRREESGAGWKRRRKPLES
jgi:hypothetical protein